MARSATAMANWKAITLATLGSSLAAGLALGANGTGNVGWHAAVRITAVVSFPIWWGSFVAGSLAALVPNDLTRAIRRQRRALGVAFAATLVVHAVTIVMLADTEPEVITPNFEFAFGGMGIVLAVLMAATSTDAAMRRLGSRWRVLHRTGQWWLFVIFAASYGGRAAMDLDYWPGAAMLVVALGLRIAAHRRRGRHGVQASPA